MSDLKSLNELLSAAAKILDDAAVEVRNIPLESKEENIKRIVVALTCIAEIQLEIYKIQPDLKPKTSNMKSPFPPEANRRFGEILLKASDLCENTEYQEAVSVFEDYLSEKPPDFFVRLAGNQIQRIKRDFGV